MLGFPKHGGKDEENLTHFFGHYQLFLCFFNAPRACWKREKHLCSFWNFRQERYTCLQMSINHRKERHKKRQVGMHLALSFSFAEQIGVCSCVQHEKGKFFIVLFPDQ